MLIDFTIRNFMSYKDEVSLNMIASTTVKECESDKDYSNVTNIDKGKRVLRAAAIYGANGSGKSTIVAAMDIFKSMVLQSFVNESITKQLCEHYYHFDSRSAKEPISMQMIFVIENKRYRYGFEAFNGKILTEWLYVLSSESIKESYCFKRKGSMFKVNTRLMKGSSGVASKTRSNALYISTAAQFNVTISMVIKEWFRKRFNILSGLNNNTLAFTARAFMHNPIIREKILNMIGIVDNCIKDIDVTESVKEINTQNPTFEVFSQLGINLTTDINKKIEHHELEIKTMHDLFDEDNIVGESLLNFKLESLGTKKLFALLGPFFDTIQDGGVLVIDEFGTSLHTKLSIELLRLFYSLINKKGAQLIVTTHDTNLLRKDLLRRDQIWFAEKNIKGTSDLYSLVEYKVNQANSVRNDASFSKDYLLGKYGAIPYFGNIDKFILDYGKGEEKE